MSKLMDKLKPCPFCGQPVSLSYGSFDHAFKIRHAKHEDGWRCYIVEPIMLDAVSLADAAEAWNRRDDK